MFSWVLLLGTAGASFGITWAIRRYALAYSLLDIPNERSSHEVPTPRGGGAAIALVFLAGLIVLKLAGFLPASLFWALAGSGGLIALIGWLDDKQDIPARYRLLGHFAGAAWALLWLQGLPPLPVPGTMIHLGWLGHIAAAFYLVWLLNLYNFMDGINGIAGIEAITVCLGGALVYVLSPGGSELWVVCLLVAVATAGFLVWNFPRARIFMGDVGSGFLGIVLGVLSIAAAWTAPELFWAWVILLGAFIADATVTLVRRGLRGEKVYQAHRSHAYQHAARIYGHTRVSLVYGTVNLIWLLPMAVLVAVGLLDGAAGVIMAYVPLVAAVVWFGAGKPESG